MSKPKNAPDVLFEEAPPVAEPSSPISPAGVAAAEGAPAHPAGAEAEPAESAEKAAAPDLEARLVEREQHIQALREQIARTQADFENYRRRQAENQERDRFVAREGIVKSLLDPLDNLERALAALEATQDVAALRTGLELVLRQVRDVLGREGLEAIAADGCKLDTALHQAVAVEQRDDVEDETIVETFQKGYTLGGRLLRPSMVKVARSS